MGAKTKGTLVPLMPVLKHLGACPEARRAIRRRGYATFRELWTATHQQGDAWRAWLTNMLPDAPQAGMCMPGCPECEREIREGTRHSTLAEAAPAVERALYDYALEQGLVPPGSVVP